MAKHPEVLRMRARPRLAGSKVLPSCSQSLSWCWWPPSMIGVKKSSSVGCRAASSRNRSSPSSARVRSSRSQWLKSLWETLHKSNTVRVHVWEQRKYSVNLLIYFHIVTELHVTRHCIQQSLPYLCFMSAVAFSFPPRTLCLFIKPKRRVLHWIHQRFWRIICDCQSSLRHKAWLMTHAYRLAWVTALLLMVPATWAMRGVSKSHRRDLSSWSPNQPLLLSSCWIAECVFLFPRLQVIPRSFTTPCFFHQVTFFQLMVSWSRVTTWRLMKALWLGSLIRSANLWRRTPCSFLVR